MKHIAMALAVVEAAEKRLEEAYSHRRLQLILSLDQEFAEGRRALQGAKRALKERMAKAEVLNEEFHWKFHNTERHDTQPETTARMRRGMKREQTKRRLHAV